MAWPTAAEMRTKYKKLAEETVDASLDLAVAEARDLHVLPRLAARYDVTTWIATPPPAIKELGYILGYAVYASKVHQGASRTAMDSLAETLWQRAEGILERIEEGFQPLLDSSGVLIAQLSAFTSKRTHKRTTKAIFSMKDPDAWEEMVAPDAGEEWDD